MKQPIRFFSIGLISAGIIMLLVITLIDKPETNIQDNMSVEQMIDSISDEGYHVLSSSEYITLAAKNDETPKEENEEPKNTEGSEDKNPEVNENEDENNESNEQEEQENEVFKYTLKIEPNMLGPEISKKLANNNIIEDDEEFNRFLEKEGYASYIQLGEFELNSEMSHTDIANTIAKKR